MTHDEKAAALREIANAIRAPAGPGHDETGGLIDSLTEAVMGMTAGLVRIAESLDRVADSIADLKPDQD